MPHALASTLSVRARISTATIARNARKSRRSVRSVGALASRRAISRHGTAYCAWDERRASHDRHDLDDVHVRASNVRTLEASS